MTLAAGTSLGSYQILSALGAGGMGEVYRARDTRLHRDVAVKVLPEIFALDPERLTRFEREAQVLASLNHPNIAQIYGVEQRALVMELVEGEDLAQRIARGAIPIEEALQIAKQIADALDAAHESGIVHRDLKPANIKLRDDGVVKVLDFGLAKAADAAASPAFSGPELPNSPTFTSPAVMTRMGVILGTAAYMSPEQARGKGVDKRSDLWAFGVVLYEMLTGRLTFDGETVTDVLAAIVTKEPDWTALPSTTPPAVRRLLQRCLTRDPRRRLSSAAEARYQIEDALAASVEAPVVVAGPLKRSRRSALAMVVPWTLAAILAAVAGYAWLRTPRLAEEESGHYSVEPPPKTSINVVSRPGIAVSSDGARLAFVATNNGVTRLYVRARTEFEARALGGTEGASEPVFSPDGRWLAFFANNALYRISVDGGPTEMLARVNDPRGVSWDTADVITYSPEATAGIFQLDPNRAAAPPKAITTLKPPEERTHRWPQALPGNKAVLFTVGTITSPDNYDSATIEAVVLATNERRVLLKGATMARYMAPGYLLFARGASVFAVRFNVDRLEVEGPPTVVIQGVGGDSTTGASNFVFSNDTVAYFPGFGVSTQHRLVWASPDGASDPIALPPGGYFDVKLSPDGRRVALQSVAGAGSDIWVHDFDKKTFTRLTFGGQNRTPAWSRDGSFVYYVSLDPIGDRSRIWRRPADGSRESQTVADVKSRIFLKSVSDDGRSALIEYSTIANKTDIGTVPLGRTEAPTPIITSEFDEYSAALSPNGRWIAYQSDESSRAEIYVREVGGKGGRWQISSEGGEEPHWSAKGDELYYRNDTMLLAAHIQIGPVFQYSPPRRVFDGLYNLRAESGISFDIDPAGTRFLMIRLAAEGSAPSSIRVITNWPRELARLMTRTQ